jgi:hypothetical protein
MQSVSTVFSIPLCNLSLYAVDVNGNATGSPVWQGKCIENVEIQDTLIKELSAPTGCSFRVPHDLDESHVVRASGLMDFSLVQQRNTVFVLYMSWQAANQNSGIGVNQPYQDRTLFGCTHRTLSASGRGINGSDSVGQSIEFIGQFYVASTGVGTPPGPASSVQA